MTESKAPMYANVPVPATILTTTETPATTLLRYVLYARKSSESEDRQVQSIDDQLHVLREVATRQGLTVVEEVAESRSAKAPGTRPDFERMLRRIETGKADAILCWSVSRLTRNPIDAGRLSWLLQTNALSAIQTPERRYLPGDNVLLFAVETGTANQFILDLRKSVERGMKSKAEKGDFPHRAPEGYRNNPFTRRVEPDPERFDVLQQAWRLLVAGSHTPAEVIRLLNDEWNYQTRPTARSAGGRLSTTSAYQIFQNVFYAGHFRHAGVVYRGNHRPMVTPEEWRRVQERYFSNGSGGASKQRRSRRHDFTYTGLMVCATCGGGVTAEIQAGRLKRGRYVYYHCNNPGGRCGKRSIREDVLERRIEECLGGITITEEFERVALDLLERWVREEFGPAGASAGMEAAHRRQQDEAGAAERMLSELFEMRLRHLIDDAAFLTKQAELKERISEARLKMESAKERLDRTRAAVEGALRFRRTAQARFLTGESAKRREIARTLAVRFVLNRGEVSIEVHPLLTMMQNGQSQGERTERPEALHASSGASRRVIEPRNTGYEKQESAHLHEPILAGTPGETAIELPETLAPLWQGYRRVFKGELSFP